MRRGDSPVKELTAKPTARNYGPTGARATKANSKKISNKKTRPTPLKWVVTPCHNVNPFPDDSNVGGHDEDIPDVVAASSSSAAVEVEKSRASTVADLQREFDSLKENVNKMIDEKCAGLMSIISNQADVFPFQVIFPRERLEGIIGKVLDDIAVTRGTSILALPVPVMSKILSYRPGQQWPLFWYRTVCRFFRDAIDEELKVPYTRTLPLHYSEKRNKWRINDKKLQKMDTAMATFFLRINSHSFLQMTVTKRHTHALPKVVDFELVVSDTKTVSTSKLLSTSEIVGLATGKPHLFSLVEYMPPLKNMLLTVTIRSPSHP